MISFGSNAEEEAALAAEHGFEPNVNMSQPAGFRSFKSGQVHVWQGRFWVRAELIDGRYRNHQAHEHLEEAFKNENGFAYGPDSNPKQFASSVKFAKMVPVS